eukprot:scaffold71810_cov54-Phaeocystis_antarctica.AAC.2
MTPVYPAPLVTWLTLPQPAPASVALGSLRAWSVGMVALSNTPGHPDRRRRLRPLEAQVEHIVVGP